MFTRRPSPTDETLRLAIEALRETTVQLITVQQRQAAIDEGRLALDRARFDAEQADKAEAKARLAKLHAQADGDDMPPDVSAAIRGMAGEDAVLRAQLLKFARTRLDRDIPAAQVAREILTGERIR